jgi:hypothetical protein
MICVGVDVPAVAESRHWAGGAMRFNPMQFDRFRLAQRAPAKFRKALQVALVAAIAGALAPCVALSHHSFAVFFDGEKSVTVTGVVTEFQFVNPHGVIKLQVKNKDGVVEAWKVETNSPSILRRRGWTPESLKVGETVTIEGWPGRENPHYARLRTAKRANGEPIGRPLGAED